MNFGFDKNEKSSDTSSDRGFLSGFKNVFGNTKTKIDDDCYSRNQTFANNESGSQHDHIWTKRDGANNRCEGWKGENHKIKYD